jgi:hypothetical protein
MTPQTEAGGMRGRRGWHRRLKSAACGGGGWHHGLKSAACGRGDDETPSPLPLSLDAGGELAGGEVVFGEADARLDDLADLGDLGQRDVVWVATAGEGGPGVDLDAGEECALATATRLLDFNHAPVLTGRGQQSENAFTLRFDRKTEHFDVLPWDAWNIAGGSKIIATGGDDPAAVRRFDVAGATPLGLAEFGREGRGAPGAEAAVGPGGEVWYYSDTLLSLVRLEDGGRQTTFSMPTYTTTYSPRDKCGGRSLPSVTPAPECSQLVTTADPVNGMAIAPDGSAWFSAADHIGHAVP